MCRSCNQEGTAAESCKTELRRRLKAALKILDGMSGEVFTMKEIQQAKELRELLKDVHRVAPSVRAWGVVKIYANHLGSHWRDAVWRTYDTKAIAEREAKRIGDHFKSEHEKRPWWGSYETHGDRFVARIVEEDIGQLSPEGEPRYP